MSALTSSIASRWSGVSVNGKACSNSRCQSESAAKAWPLRRRRSAYRLNSSPESSCAARPRLHRLPARAAQLAQRRVLAAGADVPRDLRQLVGGHEHAVIALIFQVQVVARDARHRARLEAGEARHAVVLVHDDVARAQLAEGAQRAAADAPRGAASVLPRRRGSALGAAAAQQAVLGEHGELQRRRDEALAQRRRREPQRRLLRRAARRPRPRPASSLSGVRGCRPPARPRRAAGRRRPCGSPSARASRARARPRPASARRCRPTARAARAPGRPRSPTARSAPARSPTPARPRGSRTGGGRPRRRTPRTHRSSGR